MPSNIVKHYTDTEVGSLLKSSERNGGHAEARHNMGGSGRRRPVIDDDYLLNRRIGEASAYRAGDQIRVTRAALNSDKGQEGLQVLDSGARRVTLRICQRDLDLPEAIKIRVSEREMFTLPFTSITEYSGGNLRDERLSHAIVVLEKKGGGLHIVTSFPSRWAPGGLGAENSSDFQVEWNR